MGRLYYNGVKICERLRELLPFAALLALLAVLALNHAHLRRVRAYVSTPFYAYRPTPVPANVSVIGGFTVNYPPGGWAAVLREAHPALIVDAWVGPARLGLHIRSWRLLFDGAPLQPASEANYMSLDPVKEFDHLELYDAGWELVLPLASIAPGPHTLTLQATLEDGSNVIVQQTRLQ
jgi:hypothetical protein